MPNIKITELDFTSGGPFLANENVVYIPGFSTAVSDKAILPGVPTLFKTEEEFKLAVGDDAKVLEELEGASQVDLSHVLALELLKLGMSVLYEVPTTTLATAIAVETVEAMETALAVEGFWTRLKDRGLYDIRFITSGAYAKEDTEGAIKHMLSVALERGDAVALIDHASTLTAKADVVTHFNAVGLLSGAKHGAGFTPWIYVNNKLVPGSFGYLLAFAQSVQANASWLAVAGASRGRIPGLTAPFVSIKYGEIEADALQTREKNKISVNPICNINPYGFILWGNRTLQPIGLATTQQEDLVASNFLNIRHLVSSIKKTLFVVSRGLTFEQNNDILWVNFKAGIAPLLDQMLRSNGIADYKLIRKKADKKATLKAIIRIVPIEAVEDFDLTIEISDSIEIVTE